MFQDGSRSSRRGRGLLRGWQIQNAFTNIKIIVLCGFVVTILILLGTTSIGSLGSSSIAIEINPNATTYTLGPKITNWDTQRKVWLNQNPGFPRIVNGRERILLLTGSPPGPCDKTIGDFYMLKTIKNKIDYCRLHGIEIMYNMAQLEEELSGFWVKLPMIRKLMLTHPEVEWIWWMDSDALFTDMLFEIPLSRYKNHNLVIHGHPDRLLKQKTWLALNAGVFLLRNCQWSLDLIDAWVQMGPEGPVREEAGKILTAYLTERPPFEGDDQSALIYLLLTQKDRWMKKVYLENRYYLHGFWDILVDGYEEMMEKCHPGLGDERWPFVTHFVGCKPCGNYASYPMDRCFKSMERAFNFADNQVLELYGFSHRGLSSPKIKRIRNETVSPLEIVDKYTLVHRKESFSPCSSSTKSFSRLFGQFCLVLCLFVCFFLLAKRIFVLFK